ncbi:hypothetical protein EST38_g5992 [Candolleomyces aberdarensis]|uniref:D-serine dehydratase-like domain-containing protein n=1 Tax=Candolleomyces aberdarensis TaxID=2316362 RepID=A0A4Q2DIQ1_9AGAR|nr:hypothetical protein EST38_g5992 [Candolleomyces aberdarensis]
MAYKSDNSEHIQLQERLRKEYVGKSVDEVPTPAFIIDRSIFEDNCAAMIKKANEWGAQFRAHLKTHKILYGVPIAKNKIQPLQQLRNEIVPYNGIVRLLLDHPQQVRFLEEAQGEGASTRWSVFVKVNGGQNRAGVGPASEELKVLLTTILGSPAVSLHGFYAHAGNSYGSTSLSEAQSYLSSEVQMVNEAASFALESFKDELGSGHHSQPFVLSVGSTPTAHASGAEAREIFERALHGKLELHAGNYPLLDLQQQHTSLIDYARVAQHVRATVVSYYPGRGKGGEDEALIDAGAIAFSKDTGPSGSFGEVIGKPWKLLRMSQEHGILVCKDSADPSGKLEIGEAVDIIGQHACLIAAAYPWYYIVESGSKEVVDIWIPWKGW